MVWEDLIFRYRGLNHLLQADLLVGLVLEALLHGGQGDMAVVLRDIRTEAGEEGRDQRVRDRGEARENGRNQQVRQRGEAGEDARRVIETFVSNDARHKEQNLSAHREIHSREKLNLPNRASPRKAGVKEVEEGRSRTSTFYTSR